MDGNPTDQLQFLQVSFSLIVLSNVLFILRIGWRNKLSFKETLLLGSPKVLFKVFSNGSKLTPLEERAVAVTLRHAMLGALAMFVAVVLI